MATPPAIAAAAAFTSKDIWQRHLSIGGKHSGGGCFGGQTGLTNAGELTRHALPILQRQWRRFVERAADQITTRTPGWARCKTMRLDPHTTAPLDQQVRLSTRANQPNSALRPARTSGESRDRSICLTIANAAVADGSDIGEFKAPQSGQHADPDRPARKDC